MRLPPCFVVPPPLALGTFACVTVSLAGTSMKRWFARDVGLRSSLIAAAVQERLTRLIADGSAPGMIDLFNRTIRHGRRYAFGACSDATSSRIATKNFPRTKETGAGHDHGRQATSDLAHL